MEIKKQNGTARVLPVRRWLSRGMVIAFLGRGGRGELARLEREGLLVPEYPCGMKHKRYVRAQVLAAVER